MAIEFDPDRYLSVDGAVESVIAEYPATARAALTDFERDDLRDDLLNMQHGDVRTFFGQIEVRAVAPPMGR